MSASTSTPTTASGDLSTAAGRAKHILHGGPMNLAALQARLLGIRLTDRAAGWLFPILIAAIAGALRFWRLEVPHKLNFDETYYVKQGYTLLKSGLELRWPEGTPDEKFTNGTPDIFLREGDFPVHPPVGKWMIALGEWLFGIQSSFGWRFSAAVCGTLMVLMLARTARRMFGSTLLGCVAGLLLAVDGHHLVHSRTSLLDIFLAFWVLAAFSCLVADRDWSRRKLAETMAAMAAAPEAFSANDRALGPWLGFRPWRVGAAVCLGLATGTKWSGAFFAIAFIVLTLAWDAAARRAAGVPEWVRGTVLRNAILAVPVLAVISVGTYVLSWTGWFMSDIGYQRHWATNDERFADWPGFVQSFVSLAKYHDEMQAFHQGLSSPHPYSANPWSWIIQGRPTTFFYEGPSRGEMGCTVDKCSMAITSLGNVVVWWGGALSLGVILFFWLLKRDWRAGAIGAGLVGGYLPWFMWQERTIYAFYAVAFVPFVVLALTFVLGKILGRADAPASRRLIGATIVGAVVFLALVVAWFFWPIWVGEVIPFTQWQKRMWLPSWI